MLLQGLLPDRFVQVESHVLCKGVVYHSLHAELVAPDQITQTPQNRIQFCIAILTMVRLMTERYPYETHHVTYTMAWHHDRERDVTVIRVHFRLK